MKKLSMLTRRENCFFTRDGQVLKNVKDLMEYLLNCDETNYAYHVNSQKNDFASWANYVLLSPELAESLKLSKDLKEARDAALEFFRIYDYTSKSISEDKAFHTVDDYTLKNIQELYYYVNNCDEGSFQYHVNSQKNDFANWVSDVLIFPELSAKMRVANNRDGMLNVLKDFLLTSKEYGSNPEYEKYVKERFVQTGNSGGSKQSIAKSASQSDSQSASSFIPKPAPGEETITFDKKFEFVREDDPEKNFGATLDSNTFRQFTDEELEKFVEFSKKESTIVDTDVKVEYLRSSLQELKNMVRDLRRAEKDPLVADLLLRSLEAKIGYYAQSKSINDYNYIIRQMKEVQHEIEESSEHQSYNIAEEILKDLRLQGIAMKKA